MGRRRSNDTGALDLGARSPSLSLHAFTAAALALALAACENTAPPTSPLGAARAPSLAAAPNAASDLIPDEYIVTFRDDVPDAPGLAKQLAAQHGAAVRFTYTAAIKGFAAHMSAQAAAALQNNPQVARIEQDRVARTTASQVNPTWGLDRIDQRLLPLDKSYTTTNDGAGVSVYIVDSGIRETHADFSARVAGGYSAVNDGRGTTDCNGHGTHVAGTVGGVVFGVAKAVRLYPVRVSDCNGTGSISNLLSGLDWVTKNRVLPAVANLSVQAGLSPTLNAAVLSMINAGVVAVVAAGNDASNACNYSPGSVSQAITVGASASFDAMSGFSNSGSCVDLFAPGQNIASASYASDTGSVVMSGTSMAAPHVAGVAALYLAANRAATPAQVGSAITGNATPNVLTSVPTGTANLLVYANLGGSPAAPDTTTQATPPPPPTTPPPSSAPVPDQPPTAGFSVKCVKGSCTFDASASADDKGIVSYAWSYGDGSTTAASNSLVRSTHAYATAGTYSATLTITDTGGQKTTATQAVSVRKF